MLNGQIDLAFQPSVWIEAKQTVFAESRATIKAIAIGRVAVDRHCHWTFLPNERGLMRSIILMRHVALCFPLSHVGDDIADEGSIY
jgi:hypothetical protein